MANTKLELEGVEHEQYLRSMLYSFMAVSIAVVLKIGNMGWIAWFLILISPVVIVLIFLHLWSHKRFLLANSDAPSKQRALFITSNLALVGASLLCPDFGDHSDAFLFFNQIRIRDRAVEEILWLGTYSLLGVVLSCDVVMHSIYRKRVHERQRVSEPIQKKDKDKNNY